MSNHQLSHIWWWAPKIYLIIAPEEQQGQLQKSHRTTSVCIHIDAPERKKVWSNKINGKKLLRDGATRKLAYILFEIVDGIARRSVCH